MICYNPPSPIFWFTLPVILFVLFLRFFFAISAKNAILRRRKGHSSSRFGGEVKWAGMLHSSSIIAVLGWLIFEIVNAATLCQPSCTLFQVKFRYGLWASANHVQNTFYLLKWVAITKNGSSRSFVVGKFDKPVLAITGILMFVNCALVVILLITAKVDIQGTQCNDFDEKTKRILGVYAALDILVGGLFLGVFLRPVLNIDGLLGTTT
mmetsp:Transcript_14165/g.25407  ORF Transcript_14165/g.25407 Transcript_14165/m.25407 type:complete len:209 (+) Transcript_14165:29-655(+)